MWGSGVTSSAAVWPSGMPHHGTTRHDTTQSTVAELQHHSVSCNSYIVSLQLGKQVKCPSNTRVLRPMSRSVLVSLSLGAFAKFEKTGRYKSAAPVAIGFLVGNSATGEGRAISEPCLLNPAPYDLGSLAFSASAKKTAGSPHLDGSRGSRATFLRDRLRFRHAPSSDAAAFTMSS